MRVRFGECEFDSESHELQRARRRIDITPKAFELLEALLESRPKVLPKAELHDLLWPETFVGRTSLARLVNEIRKAVGDDSGESRFVRTVSGVGYAFSGEAEEVQTAKAADRRSAWSLCWNNEEFPLSEGENTIGRDLGAVVQIPTSKVSRVHARIVVRGSSARLEDLDSKNGTFVRGQRIEGAVALRDGDQIGIGPALLVFMASSASASTATDAGEPARATSGAASGLRLAPRRARAKP
jgi:DNA-binding winged helix-turn-helix (wHTH) protein